MQTRCAALALCLSMPLALLAADWPQWRGPNRDGKSSETGLLARWPKGGPNLLWNSKTVGGAKNKNVGAGWSSLSIADGRIFTMGDRGTDCFVFALDKNTGKMLWSTAIGGTHGNGGPRCTPTVDGNHVYALTNRGQLACLSADKGEVLWKKDYVKDFGGHYMASWYFCESPLVDGDKLVCTPGGDDAAMVALNKLSGEVVWKCPIKETGGCGYSSIVVAETHGVRQYVTLMGSGKGLIGVDAATGKFLWNYRRIANGTGNIPTPVVKGNLIFTTTGYHTGAALLELVPDGAGSVTAKEKYFLPGSVLQNHHGQVILVGDHVYGGHGHNAGHPFCLDLLSGKFAWGPENGPGNGSAAVQYADGHIYFRYQDNAMALIEATPKGYHLKSTFTLPGNMGTGWPHPVIADGKLYIRGNDQILCYGVKQP